MCEGGSGGKQGDHGPWLGNSLCAEAERWIWARLSISVLSKVTLPAVASAKLLQPRPLLRWNHGPPASSSGTRLQIQCQRSQTRPNPAIVQSRQLPMEWVELWERVLRHFKEAVVTEHMPFWEWIRLCHWWQVENNWKLFDDNISNEKLWGERHCLKVHKVCKSLTKLLTKI